MRTKIKAILSVAFLVCAAALIPASSQAVTVSTYVVDGVYNNPNVVIYGRPPVFTVEYTGSASSYTIRVSTDSLFRDTTSLIWSLSASTSNADTMNLGSSRYRTFVAYAGTTPLELRATYYWDMYLYLDEMTVATVPALGSPLPYFYTVVSSVAFPSPAASFDLVVDWNNPFNPSLGGENGKTKFRYSVKDAERNALVRIFTISGEYVATAKHFAPQEGDYFKALSGQVYTAEWDGKDYLGNVVSPGIYIVNLMLEGETKGVNRRVVVIRK
jgi:hypothetical protein